MRADDTVEWVKNLWHKQVREECDKALDGHVSGSRVVLLESASTDPTGKNGYLLDDSWRLAEVGCTNESRCLHTGCVHWLCIECVLTVNRLRIDCVLTVYWV